MGVYYGLYSERDKKILDIWESYEVIQVLIGFLRHKHWERHNDIYDFTSWHQNCANCAYFNPDNSKCVHGYEEALSPCEDYKKLESIDELEEQFKNLCEAKLMEKGIVIECVLSFLRKCKGEVKIGELDEDIFEMTKLDETGEIKKNPDWEEFDIFEKEGRKKFKNWIEGRE